jgi:hypothetical protein
MYTLSIEHARNACEFYRVDDIVARMPDHVRYGDPAKPVAVKHWVEATPAIDNLWRILFLLPQGEEIAYRVAAEIHTYCPRPRAGQAFIQQAVSAADHFLGCAETALKRVREHRKYKHEDDYRYNEARRVVDDSWYCIHHTITAHTAAAMARGESAAEDGSLWAGWWAKVRTVLVAGLLA